MEDPQSRDTGSTSDTAQDASARLGLTYDIQGVDPENVPMFAKILRFLGFSAAVGFVLWGLFGDWDYSDSPFEELAKVLGVRHRNREFAAFGIGSVVVLMGWFFRFHIGAAISALFFGLLSVFSRLFKAV